jgi:SOS-response transcriptional repressor LexA
MAEADATEKELRGKGIAMMRSNITEGWVDSVAEMSQKTNTPPAQVLEFLIRILQQETMESMAKNAGTKVIFVDKAADQEMTKKDLMSALEANEYVPPSMKHNETK